jgi:hypothetical protein
VKRRYRPNRAVTKKRLIEKPTRSQAEFGKAVNEIARPWRLAISKLREQLENECLRRPADRRRFQNRRLVKNFGAELGKCRAKSGLQSYWLFCGSPWEDQLGYNEARQQHYAELKALGFSVEFQPFTGRAKHDCALISKEFNFRLDSLASWIEAHESWIVWRMLHGQPAMWDPDDSQARQQEIVASVIARLPDCNGVPSWAITAIVESSQKWNSSQWLKVLKAAVRIAGQPEKTPTELEEWVWWRYPIFSRYRWSAAEICRAARERFGDRDDVPNEAAFQSAWVRRGLRFTGRKTRRRYPFLWNFVVNEQVPKNVSFDFPVLTWIPYEKSSSKT